jgi:hypothetical protein
MAHRDLSRLLPAFWGDGRLAHVAKERTQAMDHDNYSYLIIGGGMAADAAIEGIRG